MIADIFIDRFGALADARLNETRDMAATMTLFRSAKAVTGIMPTWVTTDGHDSDPRAIRPGRWYRKACRRSTSPVVGP
jgi:hypothetical protein